MKHLLEIARIVTRKKVKKIEIFDDNALSQRNSKFNEFYEGVISEKFQTDEEAAEYLYSCKATDDKYRQLKSRFKKRLLNTLFFLDINQPNASNYNRAYYSCNKDWSLVKILMANQAYDSAAYVAKQIFSVALKFKFSDILVNCSRILREYYAVNNPDDKEYDYYDSYCKTYQNIQDAEIRSEEFYQRVVMNYTKPAKTLSESKIDVYCEALTALSEIFDSPIVHYNKFMVHIYRHEMFREYKKMLEVCDAAETYVSLNPDFYRDDKLGEICLKKASAMLHLGVYGLNTKEDKHKHDEIRVKLQEISEFELCIDIYEYHFLMSVHAGDFVSAAYILELAMQQKAFLRCNELNKEKWFVFEVYLKYLNNSYLNTETEVTANHKKRKKFRYKKFLNDPLNYGKDQRMFQIILMIAQVLLHLDSREFTEASEKIDQLKNLSNKLLNKNEGYRTLQFVKLLGQLSKAVFNKKGLTLGQKYLDRLKAEPFRYRGLLHELEILPYEKLWKLLLERLGK